MTSTPQRYGIARTIVAKYSSTLAFLLYISAVVTILLALQVIYRG